ncbi:MAG: hypothetical protein EOP84_14035 [Verrucomicrobiaceae bacterium]|nr:MAG: hypothetical protein EOP84_14035 [Verrucomicrobiaceae bacterium]
MPANDFLVLALVMPNVLADIRFQKGALKPGAVIFPNRGWRYADPRLHAEIPAGSEDQSLIVIRAARDLMLPCCELSWNKVLPALL